MLDNNPESGLEPEDEGLDAADPAWGATDPRSEHSSITPGVEAADWDTAPEPEVDRYSIPEPDQIVPTYVRNEAPWVGFGGEAVNPGLSALSGEPAIPSGEPEFTRMVRAQQRWRDVVAWAVTGAFIVAAAWFLPILLVPASPLGRVGSFATLSASGCAAVAVLWRTWKWAHRAA